jgi:hypothetical protein
MTRTFERISVDLFSLKNFQDSALASNVINLINSFSDDFIPQVYDYYEPEKRIYNKNEPQKVIEIWVNEEANKIAAEDDFAGSSLIMKKKKGHKVEYIISWEKENTLHFNTFIMSIDLSYFRKSEHLEHFLDFYKELSLLIKPVYGSIVNCAFPDWGEPVNLKVRLPEIPWGTIFGEPYIEMFGKERLLAAPYFKVDELKDGTIFLQATENIFTPINKNIRENIKRFLGEEAFVWDGKDYRNYKDGKVPEFDFSEVLFDKTKPLITPQIKTRDKSN